MGAFLQLPRGLAQLVPPLREVLCQTPVMVLSSVNS